MNWDTRRTAATLWPRPVCKWHFRSAWLLLRFKPCFVINRSLRFKVVIIFFCSYLDFITLCLFLNYWLTLFASSWLCFLMFIFNLFAWNCLFAKFRQGFFCDWLDSLGGYVLRICLLSHCGDYIIEIPDDFLEFFYMLHYFVLFFL